MSSTLHGRLQQRRWVARTFLSEGVERHRAMSLIGARGENRWDLQGGARRVKNLEPSQKMQVNMF